MPLTRAPLFSWGMRRRASASPLLAPGAGRTNRWDRHVGARRFRVGGRYLLYFALDRRFLLMSEVLDSVGHAPTLRARCGLAWRAFLDGRISESHAIRIARLADSLPDDREAWTAFDTGATERAQRLTPSSFDTAARALREKVHAESIEERHRRALRDRGVWLTAELDGMATLTALLPADKAHAAMTRLDRAARHLATTAGEERSLAQLRADALADLLAGGPTAGPPTTTTSNPSAATTTASATRRNGNRSKTPAMST